MPYPLLKDFDSMQTYKEAVFKPSPRLNLILAPNGDLQLPDPALLANMSQLSQ